MHALVMCVQLSSKYLDTVVTVQNVKQQKLPGEWRIYAVLITPS